MTRETLMAAAAATALLWGGAACAQSANEVEELVITGKLEESLPKELAQYGNRLQVVTGELIDKGGFTDIGQTLSMTVPGFYLSPQSGPFSYNVASLQGSRTSEVVYLLDGIRISNRLYGSTQPLDTIPAHMVDRIEVLEGGQSLFYGTQAVGGSINIITRPFTEELTGRVKVGVDTNEAVTVSGYASGSAGGHRFVVYASHDEATGFKPFPDADFQPSATDRHRGYKLTSAGLKYAYDFSDDLRFSATYQHTQGWVDNIRPTGNHRTVNYRNEELASAKLDWLVSDQFQMFLKGYYHDWDSHYDQVDNTAGGGTVQISDKEFWGYWDYGLNALAKFVPTPGLEAFVGYDLQKYWGRDEVLLIADNTETVHAVFAQLRITPEMIARTHLAAGVRHNEPSDGESATIWNLSGRYDLTDELFIQANGGASFRLPDAESLFAEDPLNNGEVGNPNLKPESTTSLNASIGGRHETAAGEVSWELIGFLRRTKDLIVLDGPTRDPDVFTFINAPDKVKTSGFTAAVTADLSPDWTVNASYTHVNAKLKDTEVQLGTIPKDGAQGGVDWHPDGKPYGATMLVNWVGDVWDVVTSGFGRVDHGNYVVVDLNAHYDFGPDDAHRLALRLENALDEDYATRVTRAFTDVGRVPYLVHYNGVPRTLHATYSYRF